MHDSEDTEDGQKIHGDYLRVPESGNSTNRFGNGYDNDTGGSLGIKSPITYNYRSRKTKPLFKSYFHNNWQCQISDRAIYSNKKKKKRNLVSKIRHRFTTSTSPSPAEKSRSVSSDVSQASRGRSWEFANSSLSTKIRSGIRSISADRFKTRSRTDLQHSYTSGSLRK